MLNIKHQLIGPFEHNHSLLLPQVETPTVPLPNLSHYDDDTSGIDSYLDIEKFQKLPSKATLQDLSKIKI